MTAAEQVRAALEALQPTAEKVEEAVRTAVETAHPSRVILFGSWARGEAKWDSDLDMAVLLPDVDEQDLGTIYRNLRRKLEDVPMTIDLVIGTESQFRQLGSSSGSIYNRILTQGRVAYERQIALAS